MDDSGAGSKDRWTRQVAASPGGADMVVSKAVTAGVKMQMMQTMRVGSQDGAEALLGVQLRKGGAERGAGWR